MDDFNNRIMSEPDENGRRYFDLNGGRQSGSYDYGQGSGYNNYGGNRSSGGNNGGFGQPPKKKRKWLKVVIVLVAIFLAICVLGVSCTAFTAAIIGGSSSSDSLDLGNSPYIATMYVEGTIQEGNTDYFGFATGYQHQWTLDTIDELIDDYNNYGLIIFVDSPGGGVYESDELYLKIKEYQEKTENPVYAVMGGMAASGGYYISAPCDKIYANRNTWTGSIGVTVGTMIDISGLLENYGVKTQTITSGTHKAMGSSYQEMTAEELAIWQSLVDEAYAQFAGIVAEGRDLDLDYVYEIADGRILSAYQAIELDLVDEIGGIEEAYDAMMEEIEMYDVERIDVVYENKHTTLSTILGGMSRMAKDINGSEADSIISLIEEINTTPVSYMCTVLAE